MRIYIYLSMFLYVRLFISFFFVVCLPLFLPRSFSLSLSVFLVVFGFKKCRLSFPLRNAKLAPQLFLCWTRQVQHRRLNVSEWRHPLISLLGVRKFPSMPCHPLLPAGVGQLFFLLKFCPADGVSVSIFVDDEGWAFTLCLAASMDELQPPRVAFQNRVCPLVLLLLL